MPERAFLTETWDDDWFYGLSRDQRYLFIYLWTNGRCNQAGCYHINLATMAFETKFTEEELPQLLRSLSPKVEWYPEQNYVWVKNFVRWQARSPKFLIAVARCLKNVRNNGLAREIIKYNLREHNISIPYEEGDDMVSIGYQYPIDTSLTSNTDTDSRTGSGSIAETDNDGSSLFGSFSLLRARLQKAASGSVDRLVEHERIKQELSQLGREKGLEPQSEWPAASGRVDICWVNSEGKPVAAFEIDIFEPKSKALSKLSSLDCQFRCVILRTGKAAHTIEQGVHLIGLDLGKAVNENPSFHGVMGDEEKLKAKGCSRQSGAKAETTVVSGPSETHEGKSGLATVTAEESGLLEFLKSLEGWHFAEEDDLAWLWEFRQDWPDFTLPLAKACRDYHSGRVKPKHKGIWKKRFHVWMSHDRQFREERNGKREQYSKPVRAYEWDENPEGADFST